MDKLTPELLTVLFEHFHIILAQDAKVVHAVAWLVTFLAEAKQRLPDPVVELNVVEQAEGDQVDCVRETDCCLECLL